MMSGSSSSSGSMYSCQGWHYLADDSAIGIPQYILAETEIGSSSSKYEQFCFEDGNIEIKAENYTFRLHKYKIREFATLSPLIDSHTHNSGISSTTGLPFIRLEESLVDFRNMLNVLYSPVYDRFGSQLSIATLKSTLRIATNLKHPVMRVFAIASLQERNLDAIEIVMLSREFNIPTWEALGLEELYTREKPITVSEAQVLGIEAFVELAARREARKSRNGLELMLFKKVLPERRYSTSSLSFESSDIFSDTECGPNDDQRPAPICPSNNAHHDVLLRIIDTAFSTTGSVASA